MNQEISPNDKIYINDNRGNEGLITRETKLVPNKTQEWTYDRIVFYLYNTSANKKSGSRLVFDVDKFEKYLTQTWEFDKIPELVDKHNRPAIGSIIFTLGFNAEAFDFSDPKNPKKMLPNSNLIDLEYEVGYKDNYTTKSLLYWRKTVEKDKQGNDITKATVTYQDLTDPKFGPIIQVIPMTAKDFDTVKANGGTI